MVDVILKGGKIKVPVPSSMGCAGYVVRPNKNAAGMTKTVARSGHKQDGDALRLSVLGTLDRVGSRVRFQIVPVTKTVYRLRKNKARPVG